MNTKVGPLNSVLGDTVNSKTQSLEFQSSCACGDPAKKTEMVKHRGATPYDVRDINAREIHRAIWLRAGTQYMFTPSLFSSGSLSHLMASSFHSPMVVASPLTCPAPAIKLLPSPITCKMQLPSYQSLISLGHSSGSCFHHCIPTWPHYSPKGF